MRCHRIVQYRQNYACLTCHITIEYSKSELVHFYDVINLQISTSQGQIYRNLVCVKTDFVVSNFEKSAKKISIRKCSSSNLQLLNYILFGFMQFKHNIINFYYLEHRSFVSAKNAKLRNVPLFILIFYFNTKFWCFKFR